MAGQQRNAEIGELGLDLGIGQDGVGLAFTKLVAAEFDKWAGVIRIAGVRAE